MGPGGSWKQGWVRGSPQQTPSMGSGALPYPCFPSSQKPDNLVAFFSEGETEAPRSPLAIWCGKDSKDLDSTQLLKYLLLRPPAPHPQKSALRHSFLLSLWLGGKGPENSSNCSLWPEELNREGPEGKSLPQVSLGERGGG